jgi:DNA polymerase-4
LRRAEWETSTVSIKIRFQDFSTVTRSVTLPEATDVGQRIGEAAQALFEQIDRRDPVRLVGVRAEKLRPAGGGVLALWDEDADWRRVEGAVDTAAARFGSATITRARHLGRSEGRGAPQHPRAHGVE